MFWRAILAWKSRGQDPARRGLSSPYSPALPSYQEVMGFHGLFLFNPSLYLSSGPIERKIEEKDPREREATTLSSGKALHCPTEPPDAVAGFAIDHLRARGDGARFYA